MLKENVFFASSSWLSLFLQMIILLTSWQSCYKPIRFCSLRSKSLLCKTPVLFQGMMNYQYYVFWFYLDFVILFFFCYELWLGPFVLLLVLYLSLYFKNCLQYQSECTKLERIMICKNFQYRTTLKTKIHQKKLLVIRCIEFFHIIWLEVLFKWEQIHSITIPSPSETTITFSLIYVLWKENESTSINSWSWVLLKYRKRKVKYPITIGSFLEENNWIINRFHDFQYPNIEYQTIQITTTCV